MAGLTTASLVGLEEPEDPYYAPSPSPITRWLGLDPTVSPLNAFSLLSSSLLSITFLVALNAIQPAILDGLQVPQDKVGKVTGQLILADELIALALYAVWGWIADRFGVRWVAVAGHGVISVALMLYPRVETVFPPLLLSRMLFACGASALVTALSAALSGMTALPLPPPSPLADDQQEEDDDGASLLREEAEADHVPKPEHSARFAGVLGFATGCGALLAVFVFLPLPAQLVDNLHIPIRRALRWTFSILAGLALLESLFLIVGLRRRPTPPKSEDEQRQAEAEKKPFAKAALAAVAELPRGFVLATKEADIALSYLSSFAGRSSATIVTAFIPLLVNHYFVTHGLCSDPNALADPSLPPPNSCHSAFITSSILTGVVQLISLLTSPLIGYLSSHISQPLVLTLTSLLGSAAFGGFAYLPRGGDPRSGIVWVYAVGMGVSQIGGIVVSLALVAKGRGKIVASEGKEVGGVLSAAYSFCGGKSYFYAILSTLADPLHPSNRHRYPRSRQTRRIPLRRMGRLAFPSRRPRQCVGHGGFFGCLVEE
ncbi:hypothetical protein BCR35DRAFT_171810 [Leucosporidium creatinivorum]|uniref:Major facilitator superfamily domain-containing protein n=1 Tax=Leucosporidium creatinivorum TaxID=106004 RepID=A0A1Y2E9W4_9BASI|nr:hypothetical protein BCR35DRAFT_171810 [Leucosporidium creatinivorum]